MAGRHFVCLLFVALAGCSSLPEPQSQENAAPSVASTPTSQAGAQIEVRILWVNIAHANHCGVYNADADNPQYLVEAVTIRIKNPRPSVLKDDSLDLYGYRTDGVAMQPCWQEHNDIAPAQMAEVDLEFKLPYGGEGSTGFVDTVAIYEAELEISRHKFEGDGCNNDGDCELPAGVPSLNFVEHPSARLLRVTRVNTPASWDSIESWGCEKPTGAVVVGQELDCRLGTIGLFWTQPWYTIYSTEFEEDAEGSGNWNQGLAPHISFNKDSSDRTLTVVQAEDAVWGDLTVSGCAKSFAAARGVSAGDALTDCAGLVRITHSPTSELIYETHFT